MLRPKATVLPESALVPERGARTRRGSFTHEVMDEQPFHRPETRADAAPDGSLAAGSKVVLVKHDGGPMCTVEDDSGTLAMTRFGGLRPLP